jgi:hypothetical protein
MITEMAETPKWTLRPWKSTVEKQLNSWSMYVPGQSNTPEMLEMKRFKGIIAFSEWFSSLVWSNREQTVVPSILIILHSTNNITQIY